jgi:hypothetical protein
MADRVKRIIILEGPDCAGKTTLARELSDRYGSEMAVIHQGPFPRVTAAQLPRFYVESMMPAINNYTGLIMDRSWLSEPIYGSAFRGGTNRISDVARRHLERIAMRHGAVVVLCLPPWEAVATEWKKRKGFDPKAEMLEGLDQLEHVYQGYERLHLDTDLPVVRYNYKMHGSQNGIIRSQLERIGAPLHELRSRMVGDLDAQVILVGEKASDHTDADALRQFPFCSFSKQGSSAWLTEQLWKADISEQALLWLNASDGVHQIKDLYARPTIALGQAASDALTALGIPHEMVAHPQYHKRFTPGIEYPLIPLIKSHLK